MSASPPRDRDVAAPGPFRLMRYFTIATLFAFVAVALVLTLLQRGEEAFFANVQDEQQADVARAHQALARQHEATARASLLAVHEASHVNLTRLVANMLWASDIAPLVAQARRGETAACDGAAACAEQRGRRIRALQAFEVLDDKAHAAMHATTVFKIKVFDLRGITVYSSEHAQVGEDASANQGWQAAAAGRPASELTHRDRFSAFERVVENRDLISTYVPVFAPDGAAVVGVVELYSDVTPFLEQMRQAAARFAAVGVANEAALAAKARDNRRKVTDSSNQFLSIVLGLLALLYGASLLIVRVGQRLIDRQARAQVAAQQREQLWHREKMAALATMAANVSHEVGNPLAVIAGVAQELPDAAQADGAESPRRRILEQTTRIAAMMRRIADFTSARGEHPEWIDVNTMLEAVCDFHAFDRRFRGMAIEFRPGAGLPACLLRPDQLNEVLMNLLQALAEARSPSRSPSAPLQVHTEAASTEVGIVISGDGLVPAEDRLTVAHRRLAEMGGTLRIDGGRMRIGLPVSTDPADRAGAAG